MLSRRTRSISRIRKISTFLKRSVLYATATLASVVFLALLAVNMVNPNRFKEVIEQLAADSGVHLKLNGDISHRVLSTVSITLNDVQVFDAPGRSAHEFIALKKVHLAVSPFQLINRVLRIDSVKVDTLVVTGETYADGSNTIDRFLDSLAAAAPPPPKEKPPEPPDDTATPFDIFLYNLDIRQIDVQRVAFQNESASGKLVLSDMSFSVNDFNLDAVNTIAVKFGVALQRADAPNITYDASLHLAMMFDRHTRRLDISDFNVRSTLTFDRFKNQPVNLDASLVFDLDGLALRSSELTLNLPTLLSAKAIASGTFKDAISANFDVELTAPNTLSVVSKFMDVKPTDAGDIPFHMKINGSYDDDTVRVPRLLLEIGKSNIQGDELMYALKTTAYKAGLSMVSIDAKTLTDAFGIDALRDNIPIRLNVIARGNVDTMEHDVSVKGVVDNLTLDAKAASVPKSTAGNALRVRLSAASPDAVVLAEKIRETTLTAAIPLELRLETDVLLGKTDMALTHFLLNLNDVIDVNATGTVRQFATEPKYDVRVKNSSKDLKRMILLLTAGQVKFNDGALENMTVSFGVKGDKNTVALHNFVLKNKDIHLTGTAGVDFSPLSVHAEFEGNRLHVDPFIPLPSKPIASKPTASKPEKPLPEDQRQSPYSSPNAIVATNTGSIVRSRQTDNQPLAATETPATVSVTDDGTIVLSRQTKQEQTKQEPPALAETPAPIVSVTDDGTIVFSPQAIGDLIPIPDMDLSALISLDNVTYQKYNQLYLHTDVLLRRNRRVNLKLAVGQAPHTNANVKLALTKDNDNRVGLSSTLEFATDKPVETADSIIPGTGKATFRAEINTAGANAETLLDTLTVGVKLNAENIQIKNVLPYPVGINGEIGLTFDDMAVDFGIQHLNVGNTVADGSEEKFHANIGSLRMAVDLSDILTQGIKLTSLQLKNTDVRVFKNSDGFLGIKPATPTPVEKDPEKTETTGTQSGYTLKNISIGTIDTLDTALVFSDRVDHTTHRVNLAALSLTGSDLSIVGGTVRSDDTGIIVNSLKYQTVSDGKTIPNISANVALLKLTGEKITATEPFIQMDHMGIDVNSVQYRDASNDVRLPAFRVGMSGLTMHPVQGSMALNLFDFSLPTLIAGIGSSDISGRNLTLSLKNIQASGLTQPQENQIVRFDYIRLENEALTMKDQATQMKLDKFSLNVEAPGGIDKTAVDLSFYAEKTDASADTKDAATLNVDGTLSLRPTENWYASTIKVTGDTVLTVFKNKPKVINAAVDIAYDGNNSRIAINNVSFEQPGLLSAALSGTAHTDPEKPSIDGRLKLLIANANDILRMTGGTQINATPIPVTLDLGIALAPLDNASIVSIQSNEITVGGNRMELNATATLRPDENDYSGEMDLFVPDLKQPVEMVLTAPIDSAKRAILKNVNIHVAGGLKGNVATLERFNASFDDTAINAIGSTQLNSGKTTLKLTVDTLNLDHYLPPPPPKVVKPEEESETEEKPNPFPYSKKPLLDEALKNTLAELDIDAQLTVSNLQIQKIKMDQFSVTALARKGLLQITPLRIKQKKGTLDINVSLDLRKQEPAYALKIISDRFEIGNAMESVLGDDSITGIFNAAINVNSVGDSVYDLIKHSGGTIGVDIRHAEYKKFNVDYYVCVGLSTLSLDIADQEKFPRNTLVETASLQGYIENGTLRLYDTFVDLTSIHALAVAELEMLKQTFDINVYLNIVEAKKNNCEIKDTLKKYTFKVTCDGKIYDVGNTSCAPDYGAITSLLYRGVSGRTTELLTHYQTQISNISSVVVSPITKIRNVVVDFFRFVGYIFTGEFGEAFDVEDAGTLNTQSLRPNPPQIVQFENHRLEEP